MATSKSRIIKSGRFILREAERAESDMDEGISCKYEQVS